MTHLTVTLKHPKLGYEASIDKMIAPLISLLWNSGINTSFCCQGDMSEKSQSFEDEDMARAYISFPDQENFLLFFNKISIYNEHSEVELHSDIHENYPSTLFDRIYRRPLNKWEFAARPEWRDGKPVVRTSVYFPSHDINEMVLALSENKDYKAGLLSVDSEPVITQLDQCTLVY